jgi:membrane protein DedA with SNARE-associated domain
VLRSLVSIPAGVARMPLIRFTALTASGAGIWNAIFITAGYLLAERWTVVQNYTGPISTGVVILIVLVLAYAVWRRMRARA